MKNLKKILSLVLATAMVMSLAVIGASAANFSDDESIENTEAVNTVNALGIIGGYPDGSFKPEKEVSRAEMAKMICVALNGGVDPTLGTKDTPTYNDVRNSADAWAESYIEYCTNLGIVSGVGGGKFSPSRTVTGAEAAKMLLVALGYDSDVFGFTGADWALNVGVQANNAKLYDDLSLGTADKALTRDEAAQMIYNALDAYMMTKTYDKVLSNGEISYNYSLGNETLLYNKFGAEKFTGTFTGNYNTGACSLEDEVQITGKLNTAESDAESVAASLPADLDIAEIGEEFVVIFKDKSGGRSNQPDKKDTIYGVFNTGAVDVIETTRNDIKTGTSAPTATDKIKIGSTEYTVAAPEDGVTYVLSNYNNTTAVQGADGNTAATAKAAYEALGAAQSGDTVKFIMDTNGKISAAYVVDTEIAYITSVTDEKVGISGIGTIEIADNDIYDNVAKFDVVNYTRLYDTDKDEAYFIVTKAESVTGELSSYKIDGSPATYRTVTLDGTAYTFNNRPTSLTSVSIDTETSVSSLDSNSIGETFTAYMVNGYVGYLFQGSDSANKLALVTELNTGKLGSTFDTPKVELLLADGTTVTGTVHKDSVIYNGATAIADDGTVGIDTALAKGDLVRYNETSTGVYKLVEIISTEMNGYQLMTSASTGLKYDKDTKAFAGTVVSGDSVLFAEIGGDDYKAYNLRSLNDVSVDNANTKYVVKDGMVIAAYVELAARPSGAAGETVYGIVTSYVGTSKVDGDFYEVYNVANDTESYTVYMPETSTKIAKGDLVGFEPASDNIYNDADVEVYEGGSVFNATAGLAAYVKTFSESDRTISYYTSVDEVTTDNFVGSSPVVTRALDDECVIVYVDVDNDAAGDNIGISAFDNGTGYKNVLLVKDSSTDKVVAIFVETSGEADIDA